MDYYGLYLLIASVLTGVICKELTPVKDEEHSLESRSVALSYKYSKKADGSDYFFWYRQYHGKAPEFLISHTGTGASISTNVPGFSFRVRDDKTQMELLISAAALTDSAVYYCAVRPNVGAANRIIFGSGTTLTIQTKEELEPTFYNLSDDDGETVCLATGFTRQNGTNNRPENQFKDTKATQISDAEGSPSGLYNQVAFVGEDKCPESEVEPVPCDSSLEPDEMVNLASLTIFGLRVIFMKTVAFNVLMTLRLWISQFQTIGSIRPIGDESPFRLNSILNMLSNLGGESKGASVFGGDLLKGSFVPIIWTAGLDHLDHVQDLIQMKILSQLNFMQKEAKMAELRSL